MKSKILNCFKSNYIPFLFAICAILIELTAVAVTSGRFYMSSPWMYFTVLGFLMTILFLIKSNRKRHVLSSLMLLVLMITNLLFIIIYELTETIFDFSMLNLRTDATAILENLPINFLFFMIAGIILSSFVIFGGLGIGKVAEPTRTKSLKIIVPCLLAVIVALNATIGVVGAIPDKDDPFLTEKLYGNSSSSYADKGAVGNFISEMYKGAFHEVEVGSVSEIEQFIYDETQIVDGSNDPMFGVAKDHNLVMVLAESFEWFSFVKDENMFPNGHQVDEEVLRLLYPNLYELCEQSIVMTNHRSREKTDISENLSIVGNYPLDYYLNYDYPDNNIAYALPNLTKSLYGIESSYFHNGTRMFYNRHKYLIDSVGFDNYSTTEDMVGEHMTSYYDLGERNLDSEMIRACADEMFPTDRRFNTYITTITMHGMYGKRDNLKKYYDLFDKYGVLPEVEEDDAEEKGEFAIRHYAAAAMELDAAIGEILKELRQRNLEENTMLVVFSDHNAYYQSLTNYVKDLDTDENADRNMTDLYRVPFMVKIGKGDNYVDKNGQPINRMITKSTCTADIYPTVLSLLGIKYYGNFFYGNSVFTENESILYSRAYDVFMTDKVYFATLRNVKYQSADVDEQYWASVEQRALVLLKKISYVNRLFACDYFTGEKETMFVQKMKTLNGIA